MGSLAVIGCATVLFIALRYVEQRGWRQRLHDISEDRSFALELRISLAILFALAASRPRPTSRSCWPASPSGLRSRLSVSRDAWQSSCSRSPKGSSAPLFFVWLGASLDISALGDHPKYIALGVALGTGAVITHVAMRAFGQPVAVGTLCAAQLGVPVAAATLGTERHLLAPGQPAALILGGLLTIAAATLCGGFLARRQTSETPPT